MTTPLRTAFDIVLTSPKFDTQETEEIRCLLEYARVSHRDLEERVYATQRSGARRARERLGLVRKSRSTLTDTINIVDSINTSNRVQHSVEMSRVTHFENETA